MHVNENTFFFIYASIPFVSHLLKKCKKMLKQLCFTLKLLGLLNANPSGRSLVLQHCRLMLHVFLELLLVDVRFCCTQ